MKGSWRAAEAGTGWKESLRCGGDPRIEGVLKRGWGLAPCLRVRLSKEMSGVHWWRYRLWNPSILEMPGLWDSNQGTAAQVAWSWPEPVRSCACCKWGRWRSGAAPGRSRLNPRYSSMSYKIWFMILKFALVLFKLYPIPPRWSMKVFSLFWLVGLVLFLVLFCFLW